MTIYNEIGLDKVINGSGKMTALGVSKVHTDVMNAMKRAGDEFVVIDELYLKSGEIISQYTGGEDTCVTSSASSGIALSVAAAIAKNSVEDVLTLPIKTSKRQVIIQKGHMINFGAPIDTMVKLGGADIVEAGSSNKVLREELVALINDDTCALFYVKSHHCVQKGMLSLEEMIEVGKEYHLPVIVDAAAEGDLKKYIALGADLVIYSGAKAIAGPSSGFVTGKRDLIRLCREQYKGIGRAMKIGKENIMGLLEALKRYHVRDIEASIIEQKSLVAMLGEGMQGFEGLSVGEIQDEAGRPIYRLEVAVDEKIVGMNCKSLVKALKEGSPKIYVRDHFANVGKLSIDVRSISEKDVPLIIERFKELVEA